MPFYQAPEFCRLSNNKQIYKQTKHICVHKVKRSIVNSIMIMCSKLSAVDSTNAILLLLVFFFLQDIGCYVLHNKLSISHC